MFQPAVSEKDIQDLQFGVEQVKTRMGNTVRVDYLPHLLAKYFEQKVLQSHVQTFFNTFQFLPPFHSK